MRLIYLLATLTALIGLACRTGFALPTDSENSNLVVGVGLPAPSNTLLLNDKPNTPSENGPSPIRGTSTGKHTLHKRGVSVPEHSVRMYETNLDIGNHLIGGTGGAYRQFWACDDGETMSLIEAWAGENALIGLRITFTGGIVWSVGTPYSPGSVYQTYKFRRGEYLTSLLIRTNHIGDKVAVIHFETNLRKEGGWLSTNSRNVGAEHNFKVYSGILCGMYGRFGGEVDAIGFYFLKEVVAAKLHSMEYSNPVNTPSHSVSIIQESFTSINHCFEEKSFYIDRDVTITESQSWKCAGTKAQAFRSKIGQKASESFCIFGRPPIVDSKSEFGWSHSGEYSEERIDAETTTRTEIVNFSFDAPPNTQTRATAIVVQDTLDLQFKGLWTITFQDGTSCDFGVNGIYESISSRKAIIKSITSVVGNGLAYPLTWSKCTPKNCPVPQASGFDITGESLYVARGMRGDIVIPGKFAPHFGSFIYSYKSQVHESDDFEVLIVDHDKLLWMPVGGDFKANACPEGRVLLPAGHDKNGNTYYIGRTKAGGGLNLGYTGSHMSKLEYTVFDQRTKSWDVLTTGNYDILCAQGGYELLQVNEDDYEEDS